MLDTLSEPGHTDEHLSRAQPVRAEWRDGDGRQQAETAYLLDATPHGATLLLSRPPEIGQLLRLSLPAAWQPPEEGGGADARDLMALVWALSESPAPPADAGAAHNVVSVLFVGEASATPTEEDRASPYVFVADDGGLFRLLPQDAAAEIAPPLISKRTESRIYVPIEVIIEALDANGEVTARELTVTENISRRGAAVLTTLTLPPDSLVRLTSVERQLLLTAVVRACRVDQNGVARLHLELTENEWPLEGLC